MSTTEKKELTREHKEAMAEGGRRARAVNRYLRAISADTHDAGRAELERKLADLAQQIEATPTSTAKLKLMQEQKKLADSLNKRRSKVADVGQLEADFIANAKAYAEKKGYTREMFVALGVSEEVCDKAFGSSGGA